MNTTIMVLVALIVLATACSTTKESTGSMVNDGSNSMNQPTETFKLNGGNFYFEMNGNKAPVLRVKKGDLVRVEFTSVDGFHDLVVDEFNAATDRVPTGQTASVEFVADKTGTFEYYCSVDSHRAKGMFGTLIVE